MVDFEITINSLQEDVISISDGDTVETVMEDLTDAWGGAFFRFFYRENEFTLDQTVRAAIAADGDDEVLECAIGQYPSDMEQVVILLEAGFTKLDPARYADDFMDDHDVPEVVRGLVNTDDLAKALLRDVPHVRHDDSIFIFR